jgi:hypothetical protein
MRLCDSFASLFVISVGAAKDSCTARPTVCSDGPQACFCNGDVSGLPCAGLKGFDIDATGAACPGG